MGCYYLWAFYIGEEGALLGPKTQQSLLCPFSVRPNFEIEVQSLRWWAWWSTGCQRIRDRWFKVCYWWCLFESWLGGLVARVFGPLSLSLRIDMGQCSFLGFDVLPRMRCRFKGSMVTSKGRSSPLSPFKEVVCSSRENTITMSILHIHSQSWVGPTHTYKPILHTYW